MTALASPPERREAILAAAKQEKQRRLSLIWKPRDYQLPLYEYLRNGGKRAVAVWHRRAGKDDVALNWAYESSQQRVGNYWHMLPEASQARKAIWEAVNPHSGRRRIDEAFPLDKRSNTREQEMMIRFKNGSTWQVVGSDNFDSLVGSPPVGIVFSEWALADPRSWAYLRPILLENGGWAMFIYTPRGRNHAYPFYEGAITDDTWFAQKLTVEDTGVFTPDDLQQERREYHREFGREEGEAQFLQEYYCDFHASLLGAIYGPQMRTAEAEGHICEVPFEKGHAVETWWDLGRSDDTAIWFVQRISGELRFIHYYANRHVDLDHYAAYLQEFQQKTGCVWGEHVWPHDGGHKRLGQGNQSLADQMFKLGFIVSVQPVPNDIWPGINRVRQALSRCWFDRDGCEEGIEALRMYRLEEDAKRSGALRRYYRPKPLHDWSSNGADAFRTGMMYDPAPAGWSTSTVTYPEYGGV